LYSPAIDGNTAFIDGWTNDNTAAPRVYAVSLSTHQILWEQTPAYGSNVPGVAGDGLYIVAAGNGAIYAYNQITGSLVWTAGPYGAGPNVGRPAIDSTHVYVVTGDNTLRALSIMDGSVSWSIPNFDLTYSSFPTLANGVLYAGSRNNQLQAIDPNTGAILANYSNLIGATGGAISTTVVNGNLYALTEDSGLYDIALPGTQ
jgi:outer membrane protein assembly factor BamB